MKKYTIQNGENGEPIIPNGLENFLSITNNGDGTSDLIISEEEYQKQIITSAQGMTQLSRDNKLTDIENYISNAQDAELTIFWQRAVFWDRNSAIVKSLATSFNINLEAFWTDAKQIEV